MPEDNMEPLPPAPSSLLASRAAVMARFPVAAFKMDRYHSSQLHTLFYRVLFPLRSPYLPDNPSACFYRLYQCLVVDYTTSFRNELEHFWRQSDWALVDLPDPGLAVDRDAKVRKAVMGGLTRIMARAYNRLISLGLPRDAPPVVEDWEALQARPKILERIPKWAEEVEAINPPVDIPDKEGRPPPEPSGDEDFAAYGIRIQTPHWVFV